jgi:aspartyl protease family protein
VRYRRWITLAAIIIAAPALAFEVRVIGLFPNKAVVQTNGGAVRTLSVGQKTADGVLLVSVGRDSATFEIDGQRRTLQLGQQHSSSAASSSPGLTIMADSRGQFVVDGQVNGGAVRFIVDTGATLVALSSTDARRLGIAYRQGKLVSMNTANGVTDAWLVKLDSVRVGNITVNNVDAAVIENQALPALLGMSFLNRMEMRRDGQTMVLTKRF